MTPPTTPPHPLINRQLNKPSLRPTMNPNTLQLCKLGPCQLNKLSFPHTHTL